MTIKNAPPITLVNNYSPIINTHFWCFISYAKLSLQPYLPSVVIETKAKSSRIPAKKVGGLMYADDFCVRNSVVPYAEPLGRYVSELIAFRIAGWETAH